MKDSETIIKELYERRYEFKLHEGKNMEIPVKGALGLLAIGYEGLIAWRKKRKETDSLK